MTAGMNVLKYNSVTKSPSRVGNGARKSVIFVLAQKCGCKRVKEFLL